MKTYAQILKADNSVILIGGAEVGLPVWEHELVYCIDITDRTEETIELYMIYDQETDTFAYPEIPEKPTQIELTEADMMLLELIEKDMLK